MSVPVDRVITLPDSVEISSNSTLSPLLSMPMAAASGRYAHRDQSRRQLRLLSYPTGRHRNGRRDSSWTAGTTEDNAGTRAPSYFLTLIPVRYDTVNALPTNYLMLQINPDTGRTQTYRP